jgi:hypothetical protein
VEALVFGFSQSNMEQAPIQVLRGLGGSGKGIWEKEAVRRT